MEGIKLCLITEEIWYLNQSYEILLSDSFFLTKQSQKSRFLILFWKSTVCLKTRYTEDTMLVSSDIKFIRRDSKQSRNGKACRASPTCFCLSMINLISKDTYVVLYLSCIISLNIFISFLQLYKHITIHVNNTSYGIRTEAKSLYHALLAGLMAKRQ